MSESVHITVYGHPEPQGSFRALKNKYTDKAVLTQSNKRMLPYRQMVSQTAMVEVRGRKAEKHVPVELSVIFYLAKPKSASRNRQWPSVKPDTDKLVRCILDALTGIAYVDDGQVVRLHAEKLYGEPERTEIRVKEV